MTLTIYTRACIECGAGFEVSGRAAGRKTTCSDACRAERQRRHQRNYMRSAKGKAAVVRHRQRKAERYDPWMWENTILEWWE